MDRKYLEWHGRQYRVQVKVPKKAQTILGKPRLVVPLHTDSLANANRLKYRIVADLKDQIDRAVAEADRRSKNQIDDLTEEALAWRGDLEQDRLTGPVDEEGRTIEIVKDLLYDRALEVDRSDGRQRGSYFYKVALGQVTPILQLVDDWLFERQDMKPRQRIDYQRAIRKFVDWLASEKMPASIEGTTRRTAGRYVSEAMVRKGINWRTANKDISALSVYWKWLTKKGYSEANIWQGQSLPKLKIPEDQKKRPFTDEEISFLMESMSDPLLADACRIAALSGMRLEEIARLKAQDCAEGMFKVRLAKTSAGVREVPIHMDLEGIVAERTKGKDPDEYLFHELKTPSVESAMERGQPITKKFVNFRRKVGVDDRVAGNRQSRVDFHSFRRWFIRAARDALHNGASGFDQWTIADVVGHDRESLPDGLGMTMGRYPGKASKAAKSACVAAVCLPARDLTSRL